MNTKSPELTRRPFRLEPNTLPSFYRGAGRIARWRGADVPNHHPEDWIASTARRTGMGERGLTTLADGRTLLDRIAADPHAWLGPDHVTRHGATSRMLLKLLDAGQRLPVHVHPDTEFASRHLGQPNGKAEAWVVLSAAEGASVHLGFRQDVDAEQLRTLVETQDARALLSLMNQIPVAAGDVLFCPPGVPHAIGQDILVIEIQEPSDSSIMLEWNGFPIDPEERFLGLEPALALSAVDRHGYRPDDSQSLRGRTVVALRDAASGRTSLLPRGADDFFTLEHLVPAASLLELPPAFCVLFVVDGAGALQWEAGSVESVRHGDVWLIPWAAGSTTLSGSVSVIRCAPA